MSVVAKPKPGRLNCGSAGNGSAGHLSFAFLKTVSDMNVQNKPSRSTAHNRQTCWPACCSQRRLARPECRIYCSRAGPLGNGCDAGKDQARVLTRCKRHEPKQK